MGDVKYTPGPWGIIGQPYASYWIVPKEDAETPGPKTVRRIALIEGPRPVYTPSYPIEVAGANARLIAAAPDLLEALKHIANLPPITDQATGFADDSAQETARQAISKAEGRDSNG